VLPQKLSRDLFVGGNTGGSTSRDAEAEARWGPQNSEQYSKGRDGGVEVTREAVIDANRHLGEVGCSFRAENVIVEGYLGYPLFAVV